MTGSVPKLMRGEESRLSHVDKDKNYEGKIYVGKWIREKEQVFHLRIKDRLVCFSRTVGRRMWKTDGNS